MADEHKKKAAAQQQLEPNAEGNVMVDVIMGPYRAQRLTMKAADGQAAIDGHWATAPHQMLDEDHEPHDPLTDQQRQEALTAATTWAQAQWDVAQGTATHKDERRAMKPEESEAYKTRQAEPPKR